MSTSLNRRSFMGYFAGAGLTSTLFPGVLWAKLAAGADITVETIASAEDVAGVHFDPAERELMLDGLKQQEQRLEALHKVSLPNSVAPAIVFDPVPPGKKIPPERRRRTVRSRVHLRAVGADPDDLAFRPVTELAELVRLKRITSVELTQIYLARLKKYDPVLHCVITLTEDRALKQAQAADAEIRRGKYRGPLHGIPWGAKDLLAVRGYKTTWGAGPYKDQTIDTDATVVQRLDAAGAVSGSARPPEIPGRSLRARAVLRPVPRPRPRPVSSGSRSGARRSDRFRPPRRAAASPDCVRHLGGFPAQALWRFHGRWTSWVRSVGA
jgi:hypothetical protein